MTTNSENTHSVSFPLEKVHAALSTREYWDYEAAHIGDEPAEVRSFTGGTVVEAVLVDKLPEDAVPQTVRALMPSNPELARTVKFGQIEDGRATGHVTAEVTGLPVYFTSRLVLQDAGETTTLAEHSTVEVKIPMMGSMLEPKIMEWVQDFITRESALIEKYIQENA